MKIKAKQLKLGELAGQHATMSCQEVLNACYAHMVGQKRRSIDVEHSICTYNGPRNTCCVAAPFIENYSPNMERRTWLGLVGRELQHDQHKDLLSLMQTIHDHEDSWNEEGFIAHDRVANLAEDFDLVMPEVVLE